MDQVFSFGIKKSLSETRAVVERKERAYTFSSDTSRDLRLLPTTRNSSSSSTIFLQEWNGIARQNIVSYSHDSVAKEGDTGWGRWARNPVQKRSSSGYCSRWTRKGRLNKRAHALTIRLAPRALRHVPNPLPTWPICEQPIIVQQAVEKHRNKKKRRL